MSLNGCCMEDSGCLPSPISLPRTSTTNMTSPQATRSHAPSFLPSHTLSYAEQFLRAHTFTHTRSTESVQTFPSAAGSDCLMLTVTSGSARRPARTALPFSGGRGPPASSWMPPYVPPAAWVPKTDAAAPPPRNTHGAAQCTLVHDSRRETWTRCPHSGLLSPRAAWSPLRA